MNVTFQYSIEVAQNVKTFYFLPEQPVRYIAGQFIELKIPHDQTDSRGDKRWFTLSSTPSDSLIAITTAFSGDASSSFKRELNALSEGATSIISQPMGDFVLPKDDSIPLIFIAVGIGITPFKSIITDLQHREQSRDITLIYASRASNQIAFKNTFEPLKDRFIPLISDGESSKKTLTAERVIELTQPTSKHYFYISGPELLVESLTKKIVAHGIERRHIFSDYFHGYIKD